MSSTLRGIPEASSGYSVLRFRVQGSGVIGFGDRGPHPIASLG